VARRIPWWIAPFVGSIVAITGVFAGCYLIVWLPMRAEIGRAVREGLDEALRDFTFPWVPAGRTPDLEVARGQPGFVEAFRMAGRQLHFHDEKRDRTLIAVEAWVDGGTLRPVVGEYEGSPSETPGAVRAVAPLMAMLVIRAERAREIWWTDGDVSPRGPARLDGGEANVLVFPGRLAVWAGDGPRHEIEVAPCEMVWCALGPDGLAVERRR
jgi:hypothetical protein